MSVSDIREINYCPLCGNKLIEPFNGRMISNGAICALCWQDFSIKSDDNIADLTIREVRDIIDGEGKHEDTGSLCPVCSSPIKSGSKRIADGTICANCARLERSMYFKTAYGDELDEVTIAQVKEDIERDNMYLKAALDAAPANACAVAYIDETFTDRDKAILLVGVSIGRFSENDEVILVHGGIETKAIIKEIHPADGESYEDQKDRLTGSDLSGNEFGWIQFKGIEPVYELGDYIYR